MCVHAYDSQGTTFFRYNLFWGQGLAWNSEIWEGRLPASSRNPVISASARRDHRRTVPQLAFLHEL